jgi:chromosomal replication initiation ATPase DnaA
VAGHFGLEVATVLSSTRGAPRAAYARQVAMYLAHVGFELSFETIGRVFHRDRTTVAHACRVVEDSRDDIGLDRQLAALELTCGEITGGYRRGAPDVRT